MREERIVPPPPRFASLPPCLLLPFSLFATHLLSRSPPTANAMVAEIDPPLTPFALPTAPRVARIIHGVLNLVWDYYVFVSRRDSRYARAVSRAIFQFLDRQERDADEGFLFANGQPHFFSISYERSYVCIDIYCVA